MLNQCFQAVIYYLPAGNPAPVACLTASHVDICASIEQPHSQAVFLPPRATVIRLATTL